MANYNDIKQNITENLPDNGKGEITAARLRDTLNGFVDKVAETETGIEDNVSEINTRIAGLGKEGIYDATANNDGATFASLSALLSDENLSTIIPDDVRCGGMSIRFVRSSDNKYMQYRLTNQNWSIDVNDWTGGESEGIIGESEFATGEKVSKIGIDDEPTTGSNNLVKSGGVEDGLNQLNNTKMDKSYPIYETSPLIATDTQYQADHYINLTGYISSSTGFGVLGFDCTENQKLLITGSFGGGPTCLGVFKDDNDNVKGLVLQKPNSSPYDGSVVSDYYCEVPSGATKIYVQTNKTLLQNPSCKLVTVTTYRQYSEIILQNETDIDSIQMELERRQSDFNELNYTETIIQQTWVEGQTYTLVVGETPLINTTGNYASLYIQNLKVGDKVFVKARSGSSWKFGAKVKNGVVVSLITNPSTTEIALEGMVFTVDDSFDAIVFNDYTGYIRTPFAELTTKVARISIIENNITDLQKTVNDITEQVNSEFNILCFGNSFTQDTIYYIPWLIKECEPKLKLNVYFTYMGGMPISQCLAYISNGTTIALNESGTPIAKFENHGGWDRIYSYSNGEWVEPDPSAGNYHKPYTLYKYEDGAERWVSQPEPTAASVLQMKNWNLITIQQGGETNYKTWDYYFKPYVYQIQAELKKKVNHNFTLGYIMTHASYATTSEELLNHYNGIVQNTTKMLENTPVEIVLPYATAVQNARTTYLDRFGEGGHLMSDVAHLANGIADLIGAYTNTMAILDLIGSKKSIIGSQLVPDAQWAQGKGIAQTTNIVGLSRYNIWLAQQCAVMATKYPLQLTDMVAKGMCGDTEIEIVDDTVYSSNPILSANVGGSWNTVLSAADGYAISNVVVIMGETDVTSTAYNSTTHAIDIASVSGKVTITATLVASA